MGNSMQSPACDPYELPALVSRLRSWARRLWARAVRDCGDVVQAGWLAWQAIVSEGRRPVWPDGQVEPEPGRGLIGGWNY